MNAGRKLLIVIQRLARCLEQAINRFSAVSGNGYNEHQQHREKSV
jgi:hypothetical protein